MARFQLLLDAAGVLIHGRVEIYKLKAGARFATYVVEADDSFDETEASRTLCSLIEKLAFCQVEAKRPMFELVLGGHYNFFARSGS
ncbi:hypothetical protein ABIC02_007298 [Bradyrhizobium sp. RT5a]|uniref:hypothetical protein n=1 Tax=Bradyrhizobium sp. RT3b TaxID=3156334 RepID=UPI003395879F